MNHLNKELGLEQIIIKVFTPSGKIIIDYQKDYGKSRKSDEEIKKVKKHVSQKLNIDYNQISVITVKEIVQEKTREYSQNIDFTSKDYNERTGSFINF